MAAPFRRLACLGPGAFRAPLGAQLMIMRPLTTSPAAAAVFASQAQIKSPASLSPPGLNKGDVFLVSTLSSFHGRETAEEIGVISASAFRSVNLFKDISTAILGVFGGEDSHYSHLLNQTSEHATDKLVTLAKSLGADGVVGVRLESAVTMNRFVFGIHVSVLAYGTAIKLKPVNGKA